MDVADWSWWQFLLAFIGLHIALRFIGFSVGAGWYIAKRESE